MESQQGWGGTRLRSNQLPFGIRSWRSSKDRAVHIIVLLGLGEVAASAADWYESLPFWLRAVIALVSGAITLYGSYKASALVMAQLIAGRLRREAITRIEEAATAAGAPTRDPKRATRVFLPPDMSPFEHTELILSRALSRLRGKRLEVVELTKTIDTADLEYMAAFLKASDAEGLRFLPPKIRNPIHLELTRDLLKRSNSSNAALWRAESAAEEAGQSLLFRCLLDPNLLRDVDLTPTQDGNYFVKYFQPLLVAFESNRFFRAAGTSADEQDVLVRHLKLLSERRVRAGTIPPLTPSQTTGLIRQMPQRLPAGPAAAADRKTVKVFNRKEAAVSILFLSEPASIELARAMETRVAEQWRASGEDYDAWAPVGLFQRACFFWQREQESD